VAHRAAAHRPAFVPVPLKAGDRRGTATPPATGVRRQEFGKSVLAKAVRVQANAFCMQEIAVRVPADAVCASANGVCMQENTICVKEIGVCAQENGVRVQEKTVCVQENGDCVQERGLSDPPLPAVFTENQLFFNDLAKNGQKATVSTPNDGRNLSRCKIAFAGLG
jgi:hypothetical protein